MTFDNTPELKILDAGNILILSNLQKPWTTACKDISRVFEIEYSTYRILNRSELCECSLTAGNYLLSQTDTNCRDMPEARDSYFTTYYTFNKIILDVVTVKLDIQVDDRMITQSTLLHDDIPGYNLPTLKFVLPPVNDDEDLILKEENLEIYVHLENVLVHMINTQDIAIFKSQKDYVRNKQKLLEYIHYAQMWQVLSVMFSYAAFTCDIILVLTLIIFFIRYQKTMQAMLTASITMNMNNSGILSAKANPISRTFPPLFMIKISEEEKIAEDLHKIESMQLIVQIIMIIVCMIKVPFIEKLSGHAIAKLLYKGSLGTMKIRLVDNLTVIQIINNTPSTMYLSPEESIGIVDLRSLGYYNIKPQVMHFNLTGIHNLFSKWNVDLRFKEHFAKISTQNVHYQKREVVRKSSDP